MELYIVLAVAVVVAVILIYRRKKGAEEVPQGIQIFDESGNLTFDMSTNTTRILGYGETHGTDGSIVDSAITERTWVIVTGTAANNTMIPLFTAVNGELSWHNFSPYLYSANGNVSFMYGVY